jgi:hypothetical protein
MGVTHIRYLLNQWRLRWETVSTLHALEREKPASPPDQSFPPKDAGEDETSRNPDPCRE